MCRSNSFKNCISTQLEQKSLNVKLKRRDSWQLNWPCSLCQANKTPPCQTCIFSGWLADFMTLSHSSCQCWTLSLVTVTVQLINNYILHTTQFYQFNLSATNENIPNKSILYIVSDLSFRDTRKNWISVE